MVDVMVGTNRSVSQPGNRPAPFGLTMELSGMNAVSAPGVGALPEWRPWRHGFSTQVRHTSGSTAVIWVGETLARAKLKLPSGQT